MKGRAIPVFFQDKKTVSENTQSKLILCTGCGGVLMHLHLEEVGEGGRRERHKMHSAPQLD